MSDLTTRTRIKTDKNKAKSDDLATQAPQRRIFSIKVALFIALLFVVVMLGLRFFGWRSQPWFSGMSQRSLNVREEWPSLSSEARQNYAQSLIGYQIMDDVQYGLEPSNSVNEKTVAISTLPERIRILRPDSMMTMDYWEDRLNLYIDEQNVVERFTFG